jgi:hypothetical protein
LNQNNQAVIPAKAGIQPIKTRREADQTMMLSHLRGELLIHLDTGLRRYDAVIAN